MTDTSSTSPEPARLTAPDDDVDRPAIRRKRKLRAKAAKRDVRDRFALIESQRPIGSGSTDRVLSRAVEVCGGSLADRRNFKAAIARLETLLRREIPDLAVVRSPRTVSNRPASVGLSVFETRAITQDNQRFITAECHTIVLAEGKIVFASGLLPGGTRDHLFERVYERSGQRRSFAQVQIELSRIWPSLLWMRGQQRSQGKGMPISTIVSPFYGGLLFGDLQRIDSAPPGGPLLAVVSALPQRTRQFDDFYGNEKGDRIWAMTRTFVDAALLSEPQKQLHLTLQTFADEYADVVEEHEWRWRAGIGHSDAALELIKETFGLRLPSASRRAQAVEALETITSSKLWADEIERCLESQAKHKPQPRV